MIGNFQWSCDLITELNYMESRRLSTATKDSIARLYSFVCRVFNYDYGYDVRFVITENDDIIWQIWNVEREDRRVRVQRRLESLLVENVIESTGGSLLETAVGLFNDVDDLLRFYMSKVRVDLDNKYGEEIPIRVGQNFLQEAGIWVHYRDEKHFLAYRKLIEDYQNAISELFELVRTGEDEFIRYAV